MAAPANAHGGAGAGGAAAVAAVDAAAAPAAAAASEGSVAEVLTFNDASSFDKLTDCGTMDLPMGPIELHVFKKEPTPELIERFKTSLAEKDGLLKEYITYFPDDKSLLYMGAPVSVPVCTLPAGSILHRFDKGGAVEPSKNVPIFFGNKSSVSFYSGKKNAAEINATRSSYRLKRPARLLHINTESLPRIEQLQLTPEEAEFMQVYYRLGNVQNSQGQYVKIPLITPALPYGTIAEIRRSARDKSFNRRFAEIVCRLGFDGWVIKTLNADKQEGVIQITGGIPQLRSPDGTVVTMDKLATLSREQGLAARAIAPLKGNLSAMPPEIVICRWDVFMDRIAGGGRSRRLRSSRRRQSRRRY